MLDTFISYMDDPDAWDMFVSGPPGTGKTTGAAEIVTYCEQNNIPVVVCAYTHKACNVLRSKLPLGTIVKTLHSFLRKRPTINENATDHQRITYSAKFGESEKVPVLIIDEFSQVGEQDLLDIRALQDEDYDGKPGVKVVWLGDLNQLPPVRDAEAVVPREPYWVKLTKIHRQANDNKLLDTIMSLNHMIEADKLQSLERHETFYKSDDLLRDFILDKTNKVLLAYTNKRVQELNFTIAGKEAPDKADELFCNSANRYFTFVEEVPEVNISYIDRLWDDPLTFNSKYKTLEFLLAMDICVFYRVRDEEGDYILPAVFGTNNYKELKDKLGAEAAQANRIIKEKFKADPAAWARQNPTHELARKRAMAWRKYLTFNDTVCCFDFTYAMTVHKSQGSTFDSVFLDADDLFLCAKKDQRLYLRLFYVAVSRAAKKVVTN